MKRKSTLISTGLALLLITSSFPSSVHTAPASTKTTTSTITSSNNGAEIIVSTAPETASSLFTINQNNIDPIATITGLLSKNIIRSIGFRSCASLGPRTYTGDSQQQQIKLSNLALLYDEQANTISLNAEGSTDRELDVTSAHILLTAYDRVLYDHAIDLAKVAPYIPRFEGRFSFQETFPAPSILPAQLPKQLFSLPAVEALASIQLYDTHGTPILCTSVPLTNTVSAQSPVITIASVSLTAASVALAAITGLLAFLSSAAVLTTMPLAATGGAGGTGTVGSAGGLSPSVADVVSFCQFIAMSGSLTLEYPELLQQWTQNFGWSMGLVQADGWNNAINSLRTRTSRTAAAANGEAEANKASTEKMLFNGHIGSKDKGNATTKTTTSKATTAVMVNPNAPAKVLSTQSMMDGAVKKFVEKIVHEKTQSQAISMAMANVDLSQILKPAISKRQAPTPSPPVAPGPNPTHVSAPAPVPIIGADMLPSIQDGSLMNRLGDHLAALNVFDTSKPTATPVPTPILTPPEAWPQGGYHPSTNALSPPGLVSYGQRLQIPAKNMFMTSLFLFLILLLATSMLALLLRIGLETYAYFLPGKFIKLRRRFTSHYLGGMLRVVLLAYFAVATMAFYQLTLKDSWTITLLAVMTVLLFLALVTYITLRLRRAGGTSLFFDERIKSKYGALYDQYVLSAYWFFVPVLVYQMSKAAIVGLGQCSEVDHDMYNNSHGSSESWAQVSLLLLVEISFAALTIWKRPFSDLTPNRLNGTLGCVRVLNVVMLAILIEGTALSAVTRTVVGAVIAGTQALVMIVLACLISYQLCKALWRLWIVIKASKEAKKNKKKMKKDLLSDEEVFVVSVKYEKGGHGKDDDGNVGGERPGRRASEFTRSGDESMTGLVGMMGIGSNPTIQCTPASDDENDGEEDSSDCRRRSMDMNQLENRWEEKDNGIEEAEEEETEVATKGLRESIQSYGSQSSHILDYYKSAYLPANLKSSDQNDSGSSEGGLGLGSISEDDGGTDQEFRADRLGLFVPDIDPNGPWVQSAYMTRRRSESAVRDSQSDNNKEPEDRVISGLDAIFPLTLQQQQRRRPASMGGGRQVMDAITVGASSGSSGRPATISCGSRLGRGVVRRDSLPVFKSTFIPESLLAGPPPPSTLPHRASVSSAMLATPPTMSPVFDSLHIQESSSVLSSSTHSRVESVLPVEPTVTTIPASGSSTSVTNGIQSFAEYRFPDESQPFSFEGLSRNVAAIQRNIHPLSPFHPDYQHPDDLYNAHIPSPNEAGPAFGPSQRSNSISTSTSVLGNIQNTPQDGTNSRCERRAVAAFESSPSASPSSPAIFTSYSQSSGSSKKAAHARRGDAPGLKVVTALKKFTPAPQIPLPTLPPTPFTSTLPDELMAFSNAAAGGSNEKGFHTNTNANANNSHSVPTNITTASMAGSSSFLSLSAINSSPKSGSLFKSTPSMSKMQLQRTPTSITWSDGSQDNMLHTLTQQESNTSAANAHLQRRNSSNNASPSLNAGAGNYRQRVLSSTPIVVSRRPLTASSVNRHGS